MSDRGKTKIRKEDANYVMFNLVRKKPKFDEAVLQCCHDLGSERTPRNLAEALFGSEALNTVARGCVEKELQHTGIVVLSVHGVMPFAETNLLFNCSNCGAHPEGRNCVYSFSFNRSSRYYQRLVGHNRKECHKRYSQM